MKANRRMFLSGAGAAAASVIAGSASAQNFLDDFINSSRRGSWDDRFDAHATRSGQVATNLPVLSPRTASYTEVAIEDYRNIVGRGGWPMVPARNKLQLGAVDPDVEVLRRRLMVSGDLSTAAGMSTAFDSYVDAALKRFQARHGIPQDGVTGPLTYSALNVSARVRLDQLQTNLSRLRSVSQNPGNRFVMVNIPAAEIEAVENGRVVQRHTAIVGKVDRQTPELDSKINEIIVNPYWNAPVSIVRKDIIPEVRKHPDYLEKMSIDVLGPNGQKVDPMSIDWSTDEAAKYRFRQQPGEINAMSSVKINFPNSHAVYMHDTPEQQLFRNEERFYSSGCVRVRNVRDLVTWLLRNTDGWDRRRFEQTIKNEDNVPVQLTDPVPVHFVYISAWSTGDGVVQFRDDIYGRDGASELQMSNAL